MADNPIYMKKDDLLLTIEPRLNTNEGMKNIPVVLYDSTPKTLDDPFTDVIHYGFTDSKGNVTVGKMNSGEALPIEINDKGILDFVVHEVYQNYKCERVTNRVRILINKSPNGGDN